MPANSIPTQYPAPDTARGDADANSLRTNQLTTRQQPYLGSPPNVVGITNPGTGGGAYIRNQSSDADQSQGLVVFVVGAAQAGNPVITLRFPAGIAGGQYVFFCDWGSIAAGAPGGGQIALTITPNRTLVQGERLLLAYQWAVST